MQLTSYLCRLSNHFVIKHVPGNILLGKHRIWPKLNIKYKRVLLRKIETEIENMKYTSQSYLTQEETNLINRKLQEEREKKSNEERLEKMRKNKNKIQDRLMSEHLEPLRYHKVWE